MPFVGITYGQRGQIVFLASQTDLRVNEDTKPVEFINAAEHGSWLGAVLGEPHREAVAEEVC